MNKQCQNTHHNEIWIQHNIGIGLSLSLRPFYFGSLWLILKALIMLLPICFFIKIHRISTRDTFGLSGYWSQSPFPRNLRHTILSWLISPLETSWYAWYLMLCPCNSNEKDVLIITMNPWAVEALLGSYLSHPRKVRSKVPCPI